MDNNLIDQEIEVYAICDGCNCEIYEEIDCNERDGDYFCDRCSEDYDNDHFECEDCGCMCSMDEVNNMGGLYICDRCASNYCSCDNCRDYFKTNEIIEIGGHDYCSDCASSYFQCDDCGEHYNENDETFYNVGNSCFCRDCYVENHLCESCDNSFENSNDLDGDRLCESCSESNGIRSYGSTDYNFCSFKGGSNELVYSNTRFFGIELEIGKGGARHEVANHITNEIFSMDLECKRDGSVVDGFEMAFVPMTFNYINSVSGEFNDMFHYIKNNGYSTHHKYNCGYHIHVSKASLNKKGIDRICEMFEVFWDEIVVFSRRQQGQINSWCGRYLNGDLKLTKKTLKAETEKQKCYRYRAVNLSSEKTVEFRIFNGVTKFSSFISAIQFINRICDIAMYMSDDDYNNLTWLDIIVDSNYPELIEYVDEFNIYGTDETIKSSVEDDETIKPSWTATISSSYSDIFCSSSLVYSA